MTVETPPQADVKKVPEVVTHPPVPSDDDIPPPSHIEPAEKPDQGKVSKDMFRYHVVPTPPPQLMTKL